MAIGIATPSRVAWCESKRGRDFFAWREPVDWIITNPPWSQFRPFLQHALALSDQVVFLVTINHLWTRARIRDIRTAGFGIREIVMVDMPATFPQLGFQLGAVHLERGWTGPITLTDWTSEPKSEVQFSKSEVSKQRSSRGRARNLSRAKGSGRRSSWRAGRPPLPGVGLSTLNSQLSTGRVARSHLHLIPELLRRYRSK